MLRASFGLNYKSKLHSQENNITDCGKNIKHIPYTSTSSAKEKEPTEKTARKGLKGAK